MARSKLMPADNHRSDPTRRDALWLVFARGHTPPPSLEMTRARSGIWWRRAATEAIAHELVSRLKNSGMFKAWCKYESDISHRNTKSQSEARARNFEAYKQEFRPPTAVTIAAAQHRDRTSGRRNYDQVGTYAESDTGN